MSVLNRTFLYSPRQINKILEGAKRAHDLPNLYWVVESKIPSKLTPDRKIWVQATPYPGDYIPVIAVGECPEISREFAEILLEIFRHANDGRGIEYALLVVKRETFIELGANFYEWGQATWDNICALCGAIFVDTVASAQICPCCHAQGFSGAILEVDTGMCELPRKDRDL